MKPIRLIVLASMAAGHAHASKLDPNIEQVIRSSYVYRKFLNQEKISIDSNEGVVNELTIKEEDPPQRSDAWLTLKIKTTLMFRNNASATDTNVDVKDGIVTLRGEALSEEQKQLTEEYTKHIKGVKSVQNEILVLTNAQKANTRRSRFRRQEIDDASITAQARSALNAHYSDIDLNATVKTKKGIVTLNGTVQNKAEKALAGKLVSDISGVRKVKNNIRVIN